MPNQSSCLDRAQLRTLRQQLRERESTIQAEIRGEAARRADTSYAELSGIAPDEGDAATADLLVDIDHALMDRQLGELNDIQETYERMRKRRYGICTDCGQEIGFERLGAFPTAKRCVRCQRAHEQTHATARGASL